ncbi:MAG TPA: galactokinase family protein [Thermomicrobiales bacterium]|nr:galactokinase family protein [Thermomicrobiales bacterium]
MNEPDDGVKTQQSDSTNRYDAAERALSAAKRRYGAGWMPEWRATASGRIELLGNHLDYNGGPVLAAAIDRQVVALVAPNGASSVDVVLTDVDQRQDSLNPEALSDWRNASRDIRPEDYVHGVIAALMNRGHPVRVGSRIVVAGDVPIGLGVSSSAALCVALTLALSAEALASDETVLTAREAEHRAGTPCGTMDQSASVAGGVIRFNGATLEIERLDPDLGNLVFIIADSGVDRTLGTSIYPERVRESRRALELANASLPVALPHLAAMTPDQLSGLEKRGILAGSLLRRCRHVVTETERVEAGEHALREGDWQRFGQLMTASGRSSAIDYEVSHPRVEEIVGLLTASSDVLGARMMGGGGGGSILALATIDGLDRIEASLRRDYYSAHGMREQPGVVQRCRFGGPATLEAS